MSDEKNIGLILDFDRNILDTDQLNSDFLDSLAVRGVIDYDDRQEILDDINSENDSASIPMVLDEYYNDVDQDEVVRAIQAIQCDYDFEDKSVIDGLAKEVVILTNGEDSWQRDKLFKSPFAKGLLKSVITGNKGEYIAKLLEAENDGYRINGLFDSKIFDEFIIVDDNLADLDPFGPMDGIRRVWNIRPENEYEPTEEDLEIVYERQVKIVRSLAGLQKLDIFRSAISQPTKTKD